MFETDYRPEEVILLYEAQYTDGIKPLEEDLVARKSMITSVMTRMTLN